MTELSSYVFSALREGELTLKRGSGDGLDPILLVVPSGNTPRVRPSSGSSTNTRSGTRSIPPGPHGRWHSPLAMVARRWCSRIPAASRSIGCSAGRWTSRRSCALPSRSRRRIGQVHARGLIHKDIKPANILVDTASGSVWLTGFGIASRLPREHQIPEPPEVIAGTLAYMAPEQTGRMNRSIDSRSDLYALGVTFYEMLTGTLPFTAADPMEWVHCHIARQPVPPGERVAGVPGPLAAIVMKLLAKTAEERYQTAAGLDHRSAAVPGRLGGEGPPRAVPAGRARCIGPAADPGEAVRP